MARAGEHKQSVKVTGDTSGGSQALKKLAQAYTKTKKENEKLNKTLDKTSQKLDKASEKAKKAGKAFGGIRKKITGFNAALGIGAAVGAVGAVDRLAKRSFALQGVMKSLTIDISQAERASKGMIDKFTLAKSAIAATDLQVVDSAEKYAELVDIVTKLAFKTGQDIPTALEDFTKALGRKSLLILDNFNISSSAVRIEMERVAESMGTTTSKMDEATKSTLFLDSAFKVAKGFVKDVRVEVDDGTQSWIEFKVAAQDMANTALPGITSSLGTMNNAVQSSIEFWGDLLLSIETTFAVSGARHGLGPKATREERRKASAFGTPQAQTASGTRGATAFTELEFGPDATVPISGKGGKKRKGRGSGAEKGLPKLTREQRELFELSAGAFPGGGAEEFEEFGGPSLDEQIATMLEEEEKRSEAIIEAQDEKNKRLLDREAEHQAAMKRMREEAHDLQQKRLEQQARKIEEISNRTIGALGAAAFAAVDAGGSFGKAFAIQIAQAAKAEARILTIKGFSHLAQAAALAFVPGGQALAGPLAIAGAKELATAGVVRGLGAAAGAAGGAGVGGPAPGSGAFGVSGSPFGGVRETQAFEERGAGGLSPGDVVSSQALLGSGQRSQAGSGFKDTGGGGAMVLNNVRLVAFDENERRKLMREMEKDKRRSGSGVT